MWVLLGSFSQTPILLLRKTTSNTSHLKEHNIKVTTINNMEAQLKYLKRDVWDATLKLILPLEREDAYEIIKKLPEELLLYSKPFLEHAYEINATTEDYKCEEQEELFNNLMTQIKDFCRHRIQMREFKGWKEVNKQIRQAPKCLHEGKIVISRCCPSCKKIEHNNHSCNKCTTSKVLEKELKIYQYDPECVFFVKRVCKACKTWKIQNETSAAA